MASSPIVYRRSIRTILPWPPVQCNLRKLFQFVASASDPPEPFTAEGFASLLLNCTDIRTLRTLHARLFVCGCGNSIYLGSKLLNSYANFGSLPESKSIFHRLINRNLSLWNSAIVGYFRAGYPEEALGLYIDLKAEGIGFDSTANTFCLKSCIELGNVSLGRGIHGDSCKVGLSTDKFVGSSLVGLYSQLGSINDAHQAFDEITHKDFVAYTALVTSYSQLSDSLVVKAFEVARVMQRKGFDVNRVTLVSLLQAVGHLEALKEGRSVHCYSLKRGIGIFDEVLQTSMVDMYARCGAKDSAAAMLKHTTSTVASWNAMISGLTRSGRSSEALNYFRLMIQEGNIFPDSITFVNVLSAFADLPCPHHFTSIHCLLIRRHIYIDLVMATVLIDLYSICNKINIARLLFDQIAQRDVVSYNVMISGYLQNGIVDEAIDLFNVMVREDVTPNPVTLLCLLSAFADLTAIRTGRCIHGFAVRHGFESNVDIANQIVHMYANFGQVDIARIVFDSITEKDLVSWTTMMMGWLTSGHADEALAVYRALQQTRLKPDSLTLMALLKAASELGRLELVMQIHGVVFRTLSGSDTSTVNLLIMAYAKFGRLDKSEVLFTGMEERGLASWNTMIAAYGMHGCCAKVLKMFDLMQRDNVKPDGLTFTSVLSACSHAGLVEEGWRLFDSMVSVYSILPQEEHYGCVVDLLSRAGHLEEAYDFVIGSSLRDKSSALSTLFAACRTHRNARLGEVIGRQLLDLEPYNSSTCTLISNFYAEAGKWGDAASIRTVARERGLRKVPGCSFVESD